MKGYMKFQYCFLQTEHSLLMKHFGTAQGSGILLFSKQAHSCLETKPNSNKQTPKTEQKQKNTTTTKPRGTSRKANVVSMLYLLQNLGETDPEVAEIMAGEYNTCMQP